MGKEPEKSPWLDASEIKRQVPIGSVLEAYGLRDALTGQGASLTGKSPFHEGADGALFSVNLERGIWNDRAGRPVIEGHEVAGNVIGLVQSLEKCSFREALEKLHERFIAKASPEQAQARESRGSVSAALRRERIEGQQEANAPFGKELGGLRYDVPWLQVTKGITQETAKTFGVGYCSRGLMKGRVVFPIRSVQGQIVAYAGRSLKDDDPAGKYRFPSGFIKGSELYNIDRIARDGQTRAAVAQHGIVVVAGFTDVLRLVQSGVPNAVALMGSDFDERQIGMLINPEWNPPLKITLFMDESEAGNIAKRKLASALIRRAYVRYADYEAAGDLSKTSPAKLTEEELRRVLG